MADDIDGVHVHSSVVDMDGVGQMEHDQSLDDAVLHAGQDVSEDLLQRALAEAVASENFHDHVNLVEAEDTDHHVVDEAVFPPVSHEEVNRLSNSTINNSTTTSAVAGLMTDSLDMMSQSPVKGDGLGTRANPIRIVQQGNTYTSMQQLTPEQIQQIAQVLQQQKIGNASTDSPSGSTVVFNPETNTRVVYRVVYPGDLHKKGPAKIRPSTSVPNSNVSKTGLTAQEYHSQYSNRKKRKRKCSSDEEVWSSAEEGSYKEESDSDVETAGTRQPDLTKAEKEAKKRAKPITRSGRVSKPPSHMVKDYKHIHRVDWYDDFDDSDGGYSDYKASDEDKDEPKSTSLQEGAKRKWSCKHCEKSYVGKASLARHYRMMPEHGNAEEFLEECSKREEEEKLAQEKLPGDGSNIQVTPYQQVKRKPGRPRLHPRPPEQTPDSASPQDLYKPKKHRIPPGVGHLIKKSRGRPVTNPEAWRKRNVHQLKESMQSLELNEMLGIVLPYLSDKQLSLWDLMVNKFGGTDGRPPSYTKMLQMYTALQGEMTESAKTCLRHLGNDELATEGKETIHIPDECIAISLGLQVGKYEVSELPVNPPEQPAEEELQATEPQQVQTHGQILASQLQTQTSVVESPSAESTKQGMSVPPRRIFMRVTEQGLIAETSPSGSNDALNEAVSQVSNNTVTTTSQQNLHTTHTNLTQTHELSIPSQVESPPSTMEITPTSQPSILTAERDGLINSAETTTQSLETMEVSHQEIMPPVQETTEQSQPASNSDTPQPNIDLPETTRNVLAIPTTSTDMTLPVQVSGEMALHATGSNTGESAAHQTVYSTAGDENIVIPDGASIVQTDEGFVIYQNMENSIRLSENTIPLETVQALLAMDQSGQYTFTST